MRGEPAVQKINRTGEIAKWIRGEIESGALPPGARLEERPLSERFGVSKTPVREALIQLASLGLVDLRQRRSATVTVLSVEQVVSMFEVMTEMEGMAAKLAASRMPPEDRRALAEIHAESAEFVANGDSSAYDLANTRLHERIYRGTCNEYLEFNIKDMRARLRVYRRYPFQKPGRIEQSHADHAQIVDAILRGDGATANRVMHEHITTGGRVFADLVAQMPRAWEPG
ncbi:MAG: hypothetical protein B7Y95_07365 [Rhizobiales bacterium 32-66-11]|nr:MAG: hypothetical protein B7Y95_07365 [Rhizobiales bacterium 32-66-11]